MGVAIFRLRFRGVLKMFDSLSDSANEDVRVSLVSERPAQVATGKPTSLDLKRKQRKMSR